VSNGHKIQISVISHGPEVRTAVYISRQHSDSRKTSVFHLGRSVRSCCQTWTSCFFCRRRPCLERSSCRRHFSTVQFSKLHLKFSTFLSWQSSKLIFSPFVVLVVAVFTVRRYALHGISDRNSVCLSVCLSVTLVSTRFDLRS